MNGSRLDEELEQKKEKARAYAKQYREKNKEKLKAIRDKNRDRLNEANSKYREEHKLEIKLYKKQYKENHREQYNEAQRRYYHNNKEKVLENNKKCRDKNKDKYNQNRNDLYASNKEEICRKRQENYALIPEEKKAILLAQNRERYARMDKAKIRENKRQYAQKNKAKINEYWKNRYNTDPSYKLRDSLSKRIKVGLKKQLSSKNGQSILNFLPYTIEELKVHLENLFLHPDNLTPDGQVWMNWDNWRSYRHETFDESNALTWVWHIDHIIPQAILPYTSMEDENFKKCWGLANLRPMRADLNIIEGATRVRHKVPHE